VDLALYLRVLWRFRFLVAAGVLLALVLATLSYARLSFDGAKPTLAYRQSEQWESLSTLFVTARGFPWGRVEEQLPPGADPSKLPSSQAPAIDTGQLSTVAAVYMQLATSDAVLNRVRLTGPIRGRLQVFPVFAGNDSNNAALPMLTLSAISASPETARELALRHMNAFVAFIRSRQGQAAIPEAQRVIVEIVRQPTPAALLEPRKRTRPIVVFLAVLTAVIGLAFVLENLRPRFRAVAGAPSASPASVSQQARRSA
jgi:hypothetical protein